MSEPIYSHTEDDRDEFTVGDYRVRGGNDEDDYWNPSMPEESERSESE